MCIFGFPKNVRKELLLSKAQHVTEEVNCVSSECWKHFFFSPHILTSLTPNKHHIERKLFLA